MVTKRQIRKALRTLAADLRVREQPDPESSHMIKTIPSQLHSLVPETLRRAGTPSLHLSGQNFWYYRAALELLLAHRRSRYLSDTQSDRTLTEQFWLFCCEISLDDRLRSTASQNSKVNALMDSVLIPDQEYEAIVQVQGISVPYRSLLGDVELIRCSQTLLREWDLLSGIRRPPWRGQTVARLNVTAGTIKAARRYALNRVSMICDELRIAFPSVIRARISDDQVAFKTGWIALRGNGSTLYQPGGRRVKPVRWEQTFDAAIDFLTPLYDLRETARTGIRQRADLAVQWFGMSRNGGTPWAMRIIALFAGLEALLIKGESEPRKGALLALRSALLSIAVDGHFSDLGIPFSLYLRRSELVHGARTTATESEFEQSFSLASDALRDYVSIASKHTIVYKHGKLLDLVADAQVLRRLKEWVEYHRPWGHDDLLQEIEKMLKRDS